MPKQCLWNMLESQNCALSQKKRFHAGTVYPRGLVVLINHAHVLFFLSRNTVSLISVSVCIGVGLQQPVDGPHQNMSHCCINEILWITMYNYITVCKTLPVCAFQHPSMAIVKGAGMVMKAIIEVIVSP